MIRCNFVDERGCSVDNFIIGLTVCNDHEVEVVELDGEVHVLPPENIHDVTVDKDGYIDDWYGEYCKEYDHTFIMRERIYASGRRELECVGWVYGDETKNPRLDLIANEVELKAVFN